MARTIEVIELLWLFLGLTIAQAPQDPLKDFCRRYGHQTAVIDRTLYIDGGWVYADPLLQNPVPTMNQGLIYSDLNQVSDEGMPMQYDNLSKNNTVPDVAGGILWPDEVNKVFWLYGGEYSSAPSTFQLWGYDTILNQWNTSSATTASTSAVQRVSYGAGTTIGGRGYYYGGYLNNLTNPLWDGEPFATNNMIILDMDANTLTNSTGPDGIGRAEGVMVSIPASAAGLLVYFGGVTYPYGNLTEVPMSMAEITIYDVADNKWYVQAATGNVPANRRKFCAGATWADDQSSYNIYLYGGFGFGENSTGFDDVYILTMPAFEWIKWYPDQPGSTPAPHGDLTCNVIDLSQMIVMGGNFTNSTACDVPNVGGQHNLNLAQDDYLNSKWFQYLPNLTNYSVPSAILSVTGGSPDGGASSVSPPDGWSDSALGVYFAQKAHFDPRTPTRYIPLSTGGSSSGDKPPIGAIVGGAVGGFVVLLIIALTVWWFCCRRRRPSSPDQIAQTGHPPTTVNELNADQYHQNDKLAAVTTLPSSPRYSPRQPGAHSPYDMPPPIQPGQPMIYQNLPHNPQQLYQMQQQGYVYPQYHPAGGGGGSPPALYQQYYTPGSGSASGSPPILYPQAQQYFPPPDITRMSPPVPYEMPTSRTPGVHHVVHQPIPQRPEFIESVSSRSRSRSQTKSTREGLLL